MRRSASAGRRVLFLRGELMETQLVPLSRIAQRLSVRPSELVAKQERNEARDWPDWRTVPEGQAIEHIRTGEVGRG